MPSASKHGDSDGTTIIRGAIALEKYVDALLVLQNQAKGHPGRAYDEVAVQ